MVNNLSSLTTRGAEPEAINNVIKPSLQKNEKLSTGYTFGCSSTLEGVTELGLKESVRPLYLLLLSQLNFVVRKGLTSTTMLSWTTLSLLNRTLTCETSLALEEELLSLSSAQATN
jgi:hypothetical protein